MANAGAHESSHGGDGNSQPFHLKEAQLFLACDAHDRETHGSDKFLNLDLGHSRDDQSSDWGYPADSGKSSRHDRGGGFIFGRGYDWGDFFKRGHDGGDSSGGGCDPRGGNDWNWGNPGCGNPCGGNGGPGCGGDPGGSNATPEPATAFFSLIAAGVMAVLLAGRRRLGVNRG